MREGFKSIILTGYVLSVLLMSNHIAAESGQTPGENHIKAAFLSRFLGYVEYRDPQNHLAEQSAKQICIYGNKDIQVAAMELQKVEVSSVQSQYREITDMADLTNCHLLFLGKARANDLSLIRERLSSQATLTVSDINGFAEKGGMIELINEQNRVRFILNRKQASAHGIKFAAQLLSLARGIIE